MKFDDKKPHGTIHGDTLGRRYEQNGHYFSETGEEWVAPPESEVGAYTKEDIEAAVAAAIATERAHKKK